MGAADPSWAVATVLKLLCPEADTQTHVPLSPGKSLFCTDGADRREDNWPLPAFPLGGAF